MRSSIALILAALAVPAAAPAAEVALFNGRDLTGWTFFLDKAGENAAGQLKMEDVWSVKNGILHCKGVPNGYIRTIETYTSFRLTLQWRWPEKPTNSGVLLRVNGPAKIWPRNVEAQLMSGNAGDVWAFGDAPLTCDPARADAARKNHCIKAQAAEKPAGEWNEYDITVDGERLVVKVNGVLQNEATGLEVVAGSIGLQSEGSPIEFRDIKLTSIGN